jgi:hypothetical protein
MFKHQIAGNSSVEEGHSRAPGAKAIDHSDT